MQKQVKELLELPVKESPFQFNNKIYTQTDGAAISSCLGPSLAETFLYHHETISLSDCPAAFKPLYYKSYIDDTFQEFNNIDHIPYFYNISI